MKWPVVFRWMKVWKQDEMKNEKQKQKRNQKTEKKRKNCKSKKCVTEPSHQLKLETPTHFMRHITFYTFLMAGTDGETDRPQFRIKKSLSDSMKKPKKQNQQLHKYLEIALISSMEWTGDDVIHFLCFVSGLVWFCSVVCA